MTYSIVVNGYINGKLTHRQVVTTEADDRQDAVWQFNHCMDLSGIPPDVEVRPDYRTVKRVEGGQEPGVDHV